MTELDKTILRAWSAVRARGELGDPVDIGAELNARGTTINMFDLIKRLAALTAMGSVPT